MSTTTSEPQSDTDALKRKAYANAERELRENHKQEFEDLREKHATALGVEYKRKPSAEEKAEEQMRRLLEEHPNLRSKIAPA